MAWVEEYWLESGERRYRVVERAANGRKVRGPLLLSRRDAERLAGKTGLDKQRDELDLVKKDYPLRDLLRELPRRLAGSVSESYIDLYKRLAVKLERFLDERAPGIKKLSQLTKPVLLDYRRFRLEATVQSSGAPPRASENPTAELTIAEVAKIIGYRHSAVLRLVTAGILRGRKSAGDHFRYYLVERASLEAFMASPRYACGKKLAAGHARKKAAREAANPTPPNRVRNRSINQELTMLWTMLNKAVEWGLIDDNPVATSKGLQLPEHDSRPFRALTEKEFDTFRRDCPDDLLPPLLAAALLGLREEEVRQLEWTDIDLNARMLRLSQKSNLRLKSQGWTGVKQFELRIPASLHAELMQLFLKRQAFKDNFVFQNTEGRQYPKGALRKRLYTVLARLLAALPTRVDPAVGARNPSEDGDAARSVRGIATARRAGSAQFWTLRGSACARLLPLERRARLKYESRVDRGSIGRIRRCRMSQPR